MSYVDGYVLPVPKSKLATYKKIAAMAGKIWMKHGALSYKECVGDDLNPKMGGMKIMTFPRLVKPKKGETVVFSFVVYKSKAHRDKVNAKVMKEFMSNPDAHKEMPFDMKRMCFGGFKTLVDL